MTPARANAEVPMCDKCNEINKKIAHYRGFIGKLQDQLFHEGLAKLIAELEAQKDELHPEQKKK